MADNLLRPPTPDMQGRELFQWMQRVYEAILRLDSGGGGGSTITSHDGLTENGGTGSHERIDADLLELNGRMPISEVVGESDSQTLTNKTIDGNNNTIINLKHGEEVDNPSSGVHGVVGSVVGTTDVQTLSNKTISPRINFLSDDTYLLSFDYDMVIVMVNNANITMYSAIGNPGRIVHIVNASNSNTLVQAPDTGYISGETRQEVPPYCTMSLVSTGIDWRII